MLQGRATWLDARLHESLTNIMSRNNNTIILLLSDHGGTPVELPLFSMLVPTAFMQVYHSVPMPDLPPQPWIPHPSASTTESKTQCLSHCSAHHGGLGGHAVSRGGCLGPWLRVGSVAELVFGPVDDPMTGLVVCLQINRSGVIRVHLTHELCV